jgi:hypothetical protein
MSNDNHSNIDTNPSPIEFSFDLIEDASRILSNLFQPLSENYCFICQNQEILLKEVFSDFALLPLLIFDKQPVLDKIIEILKSHRNKNHYRAQLIWIDNSDAYFSLVPHIQHNLMGIPYQIALDTLVKSIAMPKVLSLVSNDEKGVKKIINLDTLAEKFQEYAVTVIPVSSEIDDDDSDEYEDVNVTHPLNQVSLTENQNELTSSHKSSQTVQVENLISHIAPSASMSLDNEIEILALDEVWLDKSLEKYSKPLMRGISQYSKNMLARHSDLVIEILAYLPARVTYDVLQYIDQNHSGLSFAYIMEARHHNNIESFIMMDRLIYFFENGLEKELFSPSRIRLIKMLLEPQKEDSDKSHLSYQEVMSLRESASKVHEKFEEFLEIEEEEGDEQ